MTKRLIEIIVATSIIIFLSGVILWKDKHPTTVITNPIENTKVITVDRPVLTTKVVDKLITDPKQQSVINTQIKQINDLKLQVVSLTSTLADLKTSGGIGLNNGAITETEAPTTNPVVESTPANGEVAKATELTFKDFQLTAKYNSIGTQFSYDLSQSFIITTTMGKSKSGSKLTVVSLNQSTPSGLRPVPTTTTEVNANESASRWLVSPRIQGGVGANDAGHYGGIISLQWLKYGSSSAAEDTKFAILSPAIGITKASKDIGIIPINWNLGRIKHNPLSNTWFGPTVDINKRVGIALTATF